ncbi:hypothetical protein DL765_009239 [Monosporascus sp. GIB2]|nr:hypothetical protein DL765_009239 [Monosporascus sp. GIB2]
MPWSPNIRKLVIGVVPGSDANVMFPEPTEVLQLMQSLPGLEQTFIAISFEAVPHTAYTPRAALDLPKDEYGFSQWATFKKQCPDFVSRLETHVNSTSYDDETVDEWLTSLANEAVNRRAHTKMAYVCDYAMPPLSAAGYSGGSTTMAIVYPVAYASEILFAMLYLSRLAGRPQYRCILRKISGGYESVVLLNTRPEEYELLEVRVLLDTSAAHQHARTREFLQDALHFVPGGGEGVPLPGGERRASVVEKAALPSSLRANALCCSTESQVYQERHGWALGLPE